MSFWLLPGSERQVLRVRGGPSAGLAFELNPRWQVEEWEGTYELIVQGLVHSLTGPGAVFYDIGGGYGLYSLLAARRGAQVFAFEPYAANAEWIAHHARLNGLEESVCVVPAAVYSRSGLLRMSSGEPAEEHMFQGLTLPSDGEVGDELEVRCVYLDEFARSHPAPSLIKLDAEGAESEVLKGAAGVFERARPRVICEVHDAANEQFVTEWLLGKRYRLRRLGVQGRTQGFLFAEPADAAVEGNKQDRCWQVGDDAR